jgi:ElaB/YqjD/DUF883 family membrane-anchored ribosome-binding protein
MNGLRGRTQEAVPKLVQGVQDADDKIVTFVRERPVVAICSAMALGYLVGRVLSRIG